MLIAGRTFVMCWVTCMRQSLGDSSVRIMFCVIVFLCGISLANGLENLALRKPAYQSTTKYPAGRAVDGNRNQHLIHGKSCSDTGDRNGAWWEVDLGDVYYIEQVTVYNRRDCCSNRLADVQLYIGCRRWMSNYVLGGYHQGAIGRTYTFKIKPAVYGRWVRITRARYHSSLSLCEVQVFGQKRTRKMLFQLASNQIAIEKVLDSAKASSGVHCCSICMSRSDCESVNYHNASNTCDLLLVASPVTEATYNTRYFRYP